MKHAKRDCVLLGVDFFWSSAVPEMVNGITSLK